MSAIKQQDVVNTRGGLDPVTFEVIKNALMNVADLMGETDPANLSFDGLLRR